MVVWIESGQSGRDHSRCRVGGGGWKLCPRAHMIGFWDIFVWCVSSYSRWYYCIPIFVQIILKVSKNSEYHSFGGDVAKTPFEILRHSFAAHSFHSTTSDRACMSWRSTVSRQLADIAHIPTLIAKVSYDLEPSCETGRTNWRWGRQVQQIDDGDRVNWQDSLKRQHRAPLRPGLSRDSMWRCGLALFSTSICSCRIQLKNRYLHYTVTTWTLWQ